jgi:hypothetical protein
MVTSAGVIYVCVVGGGPAIKVCEWIKLGSVLTSSLHKEPFLAARNKKRKPTDLQIKLSIAASSNP